MNKEPISTAALIAVGLFSGGIIYYLSSIPPWCRSVAIEEPLYAATRATLRSEGIINKEPLFVEMKEISSDRKARVCEGVLILTDENGKREASVRKITLTAKGFFDFDYDLD